MCDWAAEAKAPYLFSNDLYRGAVGQKRGRGEMLQAAATGAASSSCGINGVNDGY